MNKIEYRNEYKSAKSNEQNSDSEQIVVWNGKDCSALNPIARENPLRLIFTKAGTKLFQIFDPLQTVSIPYPIKQHTFKLSKLDPELQLIIGSFLSQKDAANLSQVNRHFYSMRNSLLKQFISPLLRKILEMDYTSDEIQYLLSLHVIDYFSFDRKYIANELKIQKKSLSKLRYLTEDIIIDLINKYSESIRSIDLSIFPFISDKTINEIAEKCLHLRSLEIIYNLKISSKSIVNLVKKCPNIKNLCLVNCNQLNIDLITKKISKHCKGIETLDFFNSHNQITDKTFIALSKCPQLKYFTITNYEHVTQSGFFALANGSKSLQKITLVSDKVTDDVVTAFAENCK